MRLLLWILHTLVFLLVCRAFAGSHALRRVKHVGADVLHKPKGMVQLGEMMEHPNLLQKLKHGYYVERKTPLKMAHHACRSLSDDKVRKPSLNALANIFFELNPIAAFNPTGVGNRHRALPQSVMPAHTSSHEQISPHVSALRTSSLRLRGGDDSPFTYVDTVEHLVITMPIGDDVRAKDINFGLERNVLTLGVKGSSPVIDAELLWGRVYPEEASWQIDEVDDQRCVVLDMTKRDRMKWKLLFMSQEKPIDTNVTLQTFMDISINDEPAGRIEFGLYGNQVPKTVENFRCLCTGEKGEAANGKVLGYAGSKFHRIIPGFMAQGGDFTNGDGTGGESIYGAKFQDEDLDLLHDSEGLLSMANSGPDSNGSQFFITVAATPWLDGKHVVFGRVEKGMDVVRAMEAVGSQEGNPSKEVTITACGMLP